MPVIEKSQVVIENPGVRICSDSALHQIDRQIRAPCPKPVWFGEKNRSEAVSGDQLRIEAGGDVEQRPEQIKIGTMTGNMLAVVLNGARPIDVCEERVVSQTHRFDG